jgi:hypothetical protein
MRFRVYGYGAEVENFSKQDTLVDALLAVVFVWMLSLLFLRTFQF